MKTEQYAFYRQKPNRKFMQTIDQPVLRYLKKLAKKRGIIVQELLRAVVIPEWLVDQKVHKPRRGKKHHPRHASR